MFYQVRATMFFVKEDDALKFYQACQSAQRKAGVVNPKKENQEASHFQYNLCYHDENPHEPCELIGYETNAP